MSCKRTERTFMHKTWIINISFLKMLCLRLVNVPLVVWYAITARFHWFIYLLWWRNETAWITCKMSNPKEKKKLEEAHTLPHDSHLQKIFNSIAFIFCFSYSYSKFSNTNPKFHSIRNWWKKYLYLSHPLLMTGTAYARKMSFYSCNGWDSKAKRALNIEHFERKLCLQSWWTGRNGIKIPPYKICVCVCVELLFNVRCCDRWMCRIWIWVLMV